MSQEPMMFDEFESMFMKNRDDIIEMMWEAIDNVSDIDMAHEATLDVASGYIESVSEDYSFCDFDEEIALTLFQDVRESVVNFKFNR